MGQAITREIPQNEWLSFFDNFTHQYHGYKVTVEVMNEELGDQVEARDTTLDGLFVDRENVKTPGISIAYRNNDGIIATHEVQHPSHVRLEQDDQGIAQAVQIESEDTGTTLVRFRSSVPPEQLNRYTTGH